MTLAEILPAVRELPKLDRLQLVHQLLDDFAGVELPQDFVDASSFPVWSPMACDATADDLRQLLDSCEADA